MAQLCPTLCDPMDCSTPGFPVLHHLSELAQTHIHWIGDAIQPSHPLSSPSSPAFNLCQDQGLFQWVGSLHQVAKVLASVLPMNIQSWFPSGLTGFISFQSKGLSRVLFNTTVQKHQIFSAQNQWSNSHTALTRWIFVSKVMSLVFHMLSGFVISFPDGSDGKESACNAGDLGSVPESGRSPGEGNCNPLQYSWLENSMDRGTWWAIVSGVKKNQT